MKLLLLRMVLLLLVQVLVQVAGRREGWERRLRCQGPRLGHLQRTGFVSTRLYWLAATT